MALSNISQTLFFYDLETTGVNPRGARIVQFAGQRTDIELNPVSEPYNFLIKLSEEVIPEPGAVVVTGITPQKTQMDGITEAEFFKIFTNEIAQPKTVFVGFNSIRFDDEFMRFGLYRNFYDAYEWQWKDGSSKWDILDVSRMTRALRPDGMNWPFAPDGKPSNRLEYLTKVNKLGHDNAHDALSDVTATISVAKLIKQKQPKLFDYLLNIRSKKSVGEFVKNNKTFVYVSGKYSYENDKLAVVENFGNHPTKNDVVLVYNLLINPSKFLKMTPNQLADAWAYKKDQKETDKVPVKSLQFNKCPSVAPLSVLGDSDKVRLKIDDKLIKKHQAILNSEPDFYNKICEAIKIVESSYDQQEMVIDSSNVDSKLYDGFINDSDKKSSKDFRESKPEKLSEISSKFTDPRLKSLAPLYKARNYPKSLTPEERAQWEVHKSTLYTKNLPTFIKQFEQIAGGASLSANDQYVLEELKMYVESLIPSELYS